MKRETKKQAVQRIKREQYERDRARGKVRVMFTDQDGAETQRTLWQRTLAGGEWLCSDPQPTGPWHTLCRAEVGASYRSPAAANTFTIISIEEIS